jgi:hypothetical protein
MALPCIGLFPAMPLANNLEFGEWMVGNPPPETHWASERFKGDLDDCSSIHSRSAS